MTFTLDIPATLEGRLSLAQDTVEEASAPTPIAVDGPGTAFEKIAQFERLLSSVSEADLEYRSAKEEFEAIESQYKRSQTRLAEAKADRQTILEQLPKEIARVRGDSLDPPAGRPSYDSDDTVDPNSWQFLATRDLLTGVKGLGKTKLDVICDAYPTLGKLEEARAEAWKTCRHFSEVLPRGVGKGIADEIEDRMLKLM